MTRLDYFIILYAGKFGIKLDINEIWEISSRGGTNYKILDICNFVNRSGWE